MPEIEMLESRSRAWHAGRSFRSGSPNRHGGADGLERRSPTGTHSASRGIADSAVTAFRPQSQRTTDGHEIAESVGKHAQLHEFASVARTGRCGGRPPRWRSCSRARAVTRTPPAARPQMASPSRGCLRPVARAAPPRFPVAGPASRSPTRCAAAHLWSSSETGLGRRVSHRGVFQLGVSLPGPVAGHREWKAQRFRRGDDVWPASVDLVV